ncbi:aldehyde dehydrogenase (NADP(+)) [Pseudomonas sp. GL-RE-29]|uniref:aldehyde dehydrogenase (NADP(+)) n=1 Tax=Pseudomonas sp. GL-RE-29 TaxID=2832375 RepID=UPI001CBF65A8|nr:aldehyde dehydrogenase (NADP(+)) [Pseudomonas sp. GL-RE-29]
MSILGQMLIGSRHKTGTSKPIQAVNPRTNERLEPTFAGGTAADVAEAAQLAWAAFDTFRNTAPEKRARFLESCAEQILALGETLIKRASLESGLPLVRIEGERNRTVAQLRLFAEVVRAGDYLDLRIDQALPERQPLPRPDLRYRMIPLGPVAVFGASNFPLAFSVAGGDTASAFAAGCPVVVKAHSAHPGTSALVGRAIQKAVAASELPEGVFSLLFGSGNEVGAELVKHPLIKAVGFTGSRSGGTALMEIAANRPEPIPVYAEMSSINPVFLMPGALAARGDSMARNLVGSLTMGAGQFCTNPGLIVGIEGPDLDSFIQVAAQALDGIAAQTMLTPGIYAAYTQSLMALQGHPATQTLALGQTELGPNQCRAAVLNASAQSFINDHTLRDEVFGAAALVVSCRDVQDFVRVAESLEGQLTATLQLDRSDYAQASRLLTVLERKAGRILCNGYPTGVEVSHAMVHGGPFPATSDGRSTSVGAAAINRFLRPVCYQDLPGELVPEALRSENPLGFRRLINGRVDG